MPFCPPRETSILREVPKYIFAGSSRKGSLYSQKTLTKLYKMWKEETGIISISLPDVSFEVYYFQFTQQMKILSSTNQFSLCLSFLCRVTFYTGWTGTQRVVEEDPELLLLPLLLPQCQNYRHVTKPDLMWYYIEARKDPEQHLSFSCPQQSIGGSYSYQIWMASQIMAQV